MATQFSRERCPSISCDSDIYIFQCNKQNPKNNFVGMDYFQVANMSIEGERIPHDVKDDKVSHATLEIGMVVKI